MNGDLIYREDVLRVFYNKEPMVQGEHDGMGMLAHALWRHIREAVEAIPIVEAEPVVHAHWEEAQAEGIKTGYACSSYGQFAAWTLKRCPECGAHMDEEVADGIR